MYMTKEKQQKYCFSSKLKMQLGQISQYPLTVVEAPGGFGKTTAIREYLRGELPQAACEWYTCLGESVSLAWGEICGLFFRISGEANHNMKNFEKPDTDALFYMKTYLKNLKCRKKTYLVIDNYQLIDFNIHNELINIISMHENPDLHVIVIMQQLNHKRQFSVHNDNIYLINASAFSLDRESIFALFRMEGLRLTESELESIFQTTQGWVSAVRLQLINDKETGSFACSTGIEELVENTIWNRISPKEQDFLLAVSVFDSFTAYQAAEMLDNEFSPGRIESQLKASEFFRFLPVKHLFVMHSILLDYLRNHFYYYKSKEYQNKIFYKAGQSCTATGQYCLAKRFFYKVGDFEAILSLPFTLRYLDAEKEECDAEVLKAIVCDCPEEILRRHPFTMTVFAHYMLLNGQYGLYEKLCGLLHVLIQEKKNLTEQEVQKLTGELILLESAGEFNDLSKLLKGYRAASAVLEESQDVIENGTPWPSVFPTTIGILWRESGKLDEVLDIVDELKPIYHRFGKGQSAGLDYLIRAEAMLVRGKDEESEILCHKALYVAQIHEQISICIYACFCLARIFVLRGDAKNFSETIKKIQKYGVENSGLSVRRMVDICMSIISVLLGTKDYVAPWLYDLEEIRKLLYPPVTPFAEVVYFGLLLLDKRYNELYAVAQIALDELKSSDEKIKYVMPQIYYLIFLAVAKYNSGNDLEARQYLKEALDIALPDQIYLPFADHECMTELLTGLNMYYFNKGESDYASVSRQKHFAPLISLCKRKTKGGNIIRKAFFQGNSPLTTREREIALLVRERMSAKEIAARLYISEATVKSTLRSVYRKLEIHSRNELISREF
ncbi:MAG: LuxR C-terminal-related transcriptional regulator [Muricomes sp.]